MLNSFIIGKAGFALWLTRHLTVFALCVLRTEANQIFLQPKTAVTITNAAGPSDACFSDLQLVGKYSYLTWVSPGTNRVGGLLILDVIKPASPVQVGIYNSEITPSSLCVAGSHAFLIGGNRTNETSSLEVANILDPAHPIRVGGISINAQPICVRVTNNLAFISQQLQPTSTNIPGLFEIFDVHDPQNPVRLSTIDIAAPCAGFEVMGDFLYVADGLTDLAVFDVSNPRSPTQVGSYNTDEWNNYGAFEHGGPAVQIYADQGLIYSAGEDGIHILDVTIPSAPSRIGGYNLFPADYTFAISDGLVFTLMWSSWLNSFFLVAYDLSIPSAPHVLISFELLSPRKIQIRDPYAFFLGPSLTIYEIKREPAFRAFSISNEQIFLKWNAPFGFRLQGASSSTSADWTDLTDPASGTETTLPITESYRFFRLFKP